VSEQTLTRTPLFDDHVRLGARIVPFAGWEMPLSFRGITAEHQAVRERVGIFDVSHMGELRIKGEQALSQVNRLITNDLERAKDGQAVYTPCCNEAGTILDDLIVYRVRPAELLVVCNASNRVKIAAHFARELASNVELTDETDVTGLLAVQGPRSLELIARAGTTIALAELKPFRLAEGQLAGVRVMLARTGYTGEEGVEVFCAWADAAPLYRALLEAGAALGVEPIGLGARDTLRLEARLSLYGNDIDETTNPLEAGLGWTVKLDKPGGFIGQAALARIKATGLSRALVGFEMVGRGIARHGYPLLARDHQPIGICTSGAPSPTLGKNIGLGYVTLDHAAVGSEFLADCRGKALEARVVETPFYKRQVRSGTT
jgi:aminomethyltransferase